MKSPPFGGLRELAQENRRYGSPRMAALLHDLYGVNHKRKEGMPMWLRPQEAQRPNDVWAFDFVHHVTEHGQKLKMFTIIDEFTRECLEIRVEKRMRHQEVLEILDEPMGRSRNSNSSSLRREGLIHRLISRS